MSQSSLQFQRLLKVAAGSAAAGSAAAAPAPGGRLIGMPPG